MRARICWLSGSAALIAFVCGGVAHGASPADTCRTTKLLRAGAYDLCLLKAIARAARRAEAPDYLTCDAKLAAGWAKAEAKSGGSCPTSGDVGTVRVQVQGDVAAIVAVLTSTTTTTLPSLCGGAIHPGCGGSCPAGQSCWANASAPPVDCVCLPSVSVGCADTGGVAVVAATCGGACPPGEVCTTLRIDDSTLNATCGCVPAGSTPCISSGQPACGGSCPAGLSCAADPLGLFSCVCQ